MQRDIDLIRQESLVAWASTYTCSLYGAALLVKGYKHTE